LNKFLRCGLGVLIFTAAISTSTSALGRKLPKKTVAKPCSQTLPPKASQARQAPQSQKASKPSVTEPANVVMIRQAFAQFQSLESWEKLQLWVTKFCDMKAFFTQVLGQEARDFYEESQAFFQDLLSAVLGDFFVLFSTGKLGNITVVSEAPAGSQYSVSATMANGKSIILEVYVSPETKISDIAMGGLLASDTVKVLTDEMWPQTDANKKAAFNKFMEETFQKYGKKAPACKSTGK
jgi:hypothetical protein